MWYTFFVCSKPKCFGTNSVTKEFLVLWMIRWAWCLLSRNKIDKTLFGNPVFSFIKNTAKHVQTYLNKELHIRFMLSDKIVMCSSETLKSLVLSSSSFWNCYHMIPVSSCFLANDAIFMSSWGCSMSNRFDFGLATLLIDVSRRSYSGSTQILFVFEVFNSAFARDLWNLDMQAPQTISVLSIFLQYAFNHRHLTDGP